MWGTRARGTTAVWHLSKALAPEILQTHSRRPWHCSLCRQHAKNEGIRDITLDTHVINYLAAKHLPEDPASYPHIIKAATKLFLDPQGALWANYATRRPTRRIPPIGERCTLVEEAMSNLLYPSGEHLY